MVEPPKPAEARIIEAGSPPESRSSAVIPRPTTEFKPNIGPVVDLAVMTRDLDALKKFVKSQLIKGTDYGNIPGTNDKDVLFKPGAEKLASFFGLREKFEEIDRQEDFGKPFFRYYKRCRLYQIVWVDGVQHDVFIGEGEGEANSYESKWRYRWLYENQLPSDFDRKSAVTKRKWSHKYKKWDVMYRLDNEDIFSQVNTIIKIANKRAYLDAVLRATRTSEFFTQDLEDTEDFDAGAPDESQESREAGPTRGGQRPETAPAAPGEKPQGEAAPKAEAPKKEELVTEGQIRLLRTRAFAVARSQDPQIKVDQSTATFEALIKEKFGKPIDKLTLKDMSALLEALSAKNNRSVDFKKKELKV